MGIPSSSSQVPVKSTVDLLQNQIATFIEDSWRITDRLTLDLGLRHELPFNPTEAENRLAIFDQSIGGIVVASDNGQLPTDQYLPAVVAKLANSSGQFPFPVISDKEAGLAGRSILPTHTNYFGPRVGFAYQLGSSRKTIVRSGYGIFYTRYPIQYLQQTAFVNPPFAGVFNYSQAIQGGLPLFTPDNPYPSAKGSASVAPVGINRDFVLPYNQQWNLTIERELGKKTLLTLQYVGNKGTHLFRSINVNGPGSIRSPSGWFIPTRARLAQAPSISARQTGTPVSNALLVEVKRRAGRYLNFPGELRMGKATGQHWNHPLGNGTRFKLHWPHAARRWCFRSTLIHAAHSVRLRQMRHSVTAIEPLQLPHPRHRYSQAPGWRHSQGGHGRGNHPAGIVIVYGECPCRDPPAPRGQPPIRAEVGCVVGPGSGAEPCVGVIHKARIGVAAHRIDRWLAPVMRRRVVCCAGSST